MSRTDKDSPALRRANWEASHQPSSFNKACRRLARRLAKRDLENGREPLPRYPVEKEWYW